MRRLILISLFALAGCTEAAEAPPGWMTDYEAAASLSKRSNRPMLLEFGASWCAPCKKLDATTLRDKDVAYYVESGFIAVKIDGDQSPQLVEKFKVRGFPTLIMLSPDGKEIARRSGYVEPEVFLKWIMPHRARNTAAVKAEPVAVASLGDAPRCQVVVKTVSNEFELATREAEARLAERYLALAERCADAGKNEEAAIYRRKADELK
jgi:thioredoxin-like negative regulator of GroEL